MSAEATPEIRIVAAPPEHWTEALELVFRALPEPIRQRHCRETLETFERGETSHVGLLEARRGDLLCGAVWSQLQPGRLANLWPPQLSVSEPLAAGLARRLIDAATETAASGGARLAQALLETDTGNLADAFRESGFQHLSDLLYLVSPSQAFPTAEPAANLEFEPYSAADHDRLARIVEQTYFATRDCPQLNGVRPIGEVLASYRAMGRFDPARWMFVRHASRDVGCLLLTEHPEKVWELVYMGIVPGERGHGWGLEITRHGQWLARQAGAARLVLAVDAANAPAIRLYAAAGLAAWDRRSVWMRVFG